MRRRSRQARRLPKGNTTEEILMIDRLGRSGDGLSGDISVPYTLPGETVRAAVSGKQGEPLDILEPSPHRERAICAHFGLPGQGCGGCHLQHLGLAASLDWKVSRLRGALDHFDLPIPEIETYQSPPQSRRRARLGLIRTGKGWQMGFRRWRSHHVTSMSECHVLAPQLFDIASALTAKASQLLPRDIKSADLFLTLTDTGIDADISGIEESSLELDHRMALAAFAAEHDLARLSVANVPMAQARTPQMHFDEISVALPTGTFLQATEDGQNFLTRKVISGVEDARRVADLFCGLGTFALPLTEMAALTAIDSDGPAITALTAATRSRGMVMDTATRDLFDRPLMPDELAGFDAVVMDPPRAGAEAQAEMLLKSTVPVAVSVSCNPDTFARDAAILSAAYDLTSLALLDQFLWSPHIEVIGVFQRRP